MKFQALSFFLFAFFGAKAQPDSLAPAYKRYPVIPGLQLFLSDSIKYTNKDLPKKKQLLLMLFSPDCDHCQHEAKEIVARRADFRNTHIIMVTTYPIARMNQFAATYGLSKMDNVVMAKDPFYVLISFFGIRQFPYLALYDKAGKFVNTFEGSVGIDTILAAFQKGK